MGSTLQRLVLIALVFGLVYFLESEPVSVVPASTDRIVNQLTASNSTIAEAYENRRSNLQVEGSGVVTRILSDDNNGDRHQRFIIGLQSGQTLLVAHNIDLAPRISSLKVDDAVEFFGEYEWNDQGGVMHWTHKDPRGRHVAGWLKHNGRMYQ